MNFFEKSKIKTNFNNANQNYESSAILQKIVAQNLVSFANNDIAKANKIIDLGCGTGFVFKQFSKQNQSIFQLDIAYKMLCVNNKKFNKINGDIEFLPFRRNSFDLALSSLSFQWLNYLEESIFEVIDVISDNGNFYFSLITEGSLAELKESCQRCNVSLSINNFISIKNLKTILDKINLDYQLKSEEIILEYQNLYSLLKSIKLIGANYSKNTQYVGKRQFDKIAKFYLENFYLDNKVFSTWKVTYVVIKKSTKNV
jgi:malonyl-CoA O-methyltransferase